MATGVVKEQSENLVINCIRNGNWCGIRAKRKSRYKLYLKWQLVWYESKAKVSL